jgi:hypothetical protein
MLNKAMTASYIQSFCHAALYNLRVTDILIEKAITIVTVIVMWRSYTLTLTN